MKYAKKSSPPRVKDELTNRALIILDGELVKMARVINSKTVFITSTEPDKPFAGTVWVDIS